MGNYPQSQKGKSNVGVEEKRVIVTLHQRDVLVLLSKHARLSIGELASLLGVSSVATVKIANRLEQKQLVRRVVDEWDRRRVFIHLTAGGWSIVNRSSM